MFFLKTPRNLFQFNPFQGLRTNWSDLHHSYQKLSLLTDTLPKKLRREQMEAQMDTIERFVALLEAHAVIIIADNPYQVY